MGKRFTAFAAALILLMAGPVRAHNGGIAVAAPVANITVDGDLSDWPERLATPEKVYLNRRRFFRQLGAASLGLVAAPSLLGAEEGAALYPAKRNPAYILDRALTDEQVAASYNNFYELTTD